MKKTFESQYDALIYADAQPDWRVGNRHGIEPTVFDVHTQIFYRLKKSGGFFLDPWYSWQEEK